MSWWDSVNEFINKPLPIIGISILTLFMLLWFFLKYTGVGKKLVNKVFARCEETDAKYLELRKEKDELKKELEEEKEARKKDREEFEQKIAEIYGEFKTDIDNFYKGLGYINNVNVKEVVKEYGERKNG